MDRGRIEALLAGDGDDAQALPGASWALIRNGRVRESGAEGYADPRDRRRLRADTPMRVASISKISTALTLMSLVAERKVSLDADAGEYLGFDLRNPAYPNAAIRVRQLLSHTSSMRDGEVYWAGLGERIADFFTPGASHWENGAHWDPTRGPGANYFKYCNLAFGVLATIVERVGGDRFDHAAHARVFGPLELDCGFNWSECERGYVARGSPVWRRAASGAWQAEVDDPLPVGRGAVFLNPDNLPISSYRLGENGLLFSPQGGLRASVRDLARIGIKLLDDNEPVSLMRQPVWRLDRYDNGDTENGFWRRYGFGLQIVEPGEGSPIANQAHTLVGHSGDAYGLRGGVWIDPESADGFAFLFNGGPADDKRARGARSAFSRPEEAMMQLLYDAANAPDRGGSGRP